MASEEQKQDRKVKLTVLAVVVVLGLCVYGIGPGLGKVLDHWRLKKNDPQAPVWYYRVATIYSSTFREAKAKEVWEEFYLTYSGNEANVEGLDVALQHMEMAPDDWPNRHFIPWIANRYSETNPRPAWLGVSSDPKAPLIGGENAKPHPLLQDVLYDYGKTFEDGRNYFEARHLYSCALYCFPGGTKVATKLEAAKLRLLVKGWRF